MSLHVPFFFSFRFKTLGWGRTVGGGQGANYLQQAMLPVAEDRRCQSVNGRLGRVYSDTMICAGGQGRGGCQVKLDDYNIAKIGIFLRTIS